MADPTGASEEEVAQLRRALGLVTQQAAHLEQALATNRRIGVAVGIVMERHKVTAEDAFDVLVRLSMERNEKLRDVADRVVGTGDLPQAG